MPKSALEVANIMGFVRRRAIEFVNGPGGKKDRKLTAGSVAGFSKDRFKKLSGRYLGHWTVRKIGRVLRINQLSDTKI
jgi:hypothetical protein